MKKILLFVAASCLLVQNAAAQFILDRSGSATPETKAAVSPLADDTDTKEIVFGYCHNDINGLGTGGVNVTLKGAIGISKAKATELKGNRITKIRIGYGQSSNRNVEVFISRTVAGTPLYKQTAQITTQNGWNEVALDTPFEIDGSAFYIGYQTVTKASTDYPIGVDGFSTSDRLANSIYDGSRWGNYGSDYGAVCLRAVIEGDNLAEYDITVTDFDVQGLVKLDTPFDAVVNFTNSGTATITELTASCLIDGKTVTPSSMKIYPEAVAPGEFGELHIDGLVCEIEGMDLPIELTVTKVNGQDDENITDNVVSTTISCTQEVYARNVVVEEWTGNWCGWCPRGIVGMEYMEDKYGDEGFIGIAVHASSSLGSGTEPMECSSYLSLLYKYCDGFPGCIINRTYSCDPSAGNLESYYLSAVKTPSVAKVDVYANYYDDDPTKLYMSANTRFALSSENANYKLAFVITENGVGPYYQTNYYAGGGSGEMGGWQSKGSRVSTIYEHVARDIFDALGLSGSVPSEIVSSKVYTYDFVGSTTNVDDIDNCHVIALLINSKTGEIENAAKTSINHQAGVSDAVSNGSVSVKGLKGLIQIDGDYASCDIYGLDGISVGSLNGENSVILPSGLYIVKVVEANGSTSNRKVIVR